MSGKHLDADQAHRYVAGLLDSRELAAVTAHLAECEQCQGRVVEERSWSGIFRLVAGSAEGEAQAEPRELARRLELQISRRLRRQRLGRTLAVGLASGALGLLAGLGYRGLTADSPRELSARALGVNHSTQAAVVANLAALQALRDDPWLATELDTVLVFEQLLSTEGG